MRCGNWRIVDISNIIRTTHRLILTFQASGKERVGQEREAGECILIGESSEGEYLSLCDFGEFQPVHGLGTVGREYDYQIEFIGGDPVNGRCG